MSQPYAYAPPTAGGDPGAIVRLLKETGPWVRLLAILGFIGTGFLVLAAAAMLLVGALMPGLGEKGVAPVALAIAYVVSAGVYLVVAVLMNNYANAIARTVEGAPTGIVDAVDAQRKLWKLVGILAIVSVGIMVLACVVGLVVGFAGAFSAAK